MIKNILSESAPASLPGQLCVQCWATNSAGSQLVFTSVEFSITDAMQAVNDKWKEIRSRNTSLWYEITDRRGFKASGNLNNKTYKP